MTTDVLADTNNPALDTMINAIGLGMTPGATPAPREPVASRPMTAEEIAIAWTVQYVRAQLLDFAGEYCEVDKADEFKALMKLDSLIKSITPGEVLAA